MLSCNKRERYRNSQQKAPPRSVKIDDIARLFNGLASMSGFLTWHTRLSMVRAVSAGGHAAIAEKARVSEA
jgi:hypothetical protein